MVVIKPILFNQWILVKKIIKLGLKNHLFLEKYKKKKKIEEKNVKIEKKSKSIISEQSPLTNSQKDFEEDGKDIKDLENKNKEN